MQNNKKERNQRKNTITKIEFDKIIKYCEKTGMLEARACLLERETDLLDIEEIALLGERGNLFEELIEMNSVCFLKALDFFATKEVPAPFNDFASTKCRLQPLWDKLDKQKLFLNYNCKTLSDRKLSREKIIFNFEYIHSIIDDAAAKNHFKRLTGLDEIKNIKISLKDLYSSVVLCNYGNQGNQSHYEIVLLSTALSTLISYALHRGLSDTERGTPVLFIPESIILQ